jgi:hypothetical protein
MPVGFGAHKPRAEARDFFTGSVCRSSGRSEKRVQDHDRSGGIDLGVWSKVLAMLLVQTQEGDFRNSDIEGKNPLFLHAE